MAENCVFFLPLSYLAPSLPSFPSEFRGEINHEETRVMGLPGGESCIILTSTVFDWSTRVTDGQTDGRAIAYARYSIMLSRANIQYSITRLRLACWHMPLPYICLFSLIGWCV